jgi:hypothetical protein
LDGARDIGADHVPDISEVLIKESMAQSSPRIGEQRVDRTADLFRCIDAPVTIANCRLPDIARSVT